MTSRSSGSGLLVRGGRLPDWRAAAGVAASGAGTRIEPGRALDVRIAGGVVTQLGAGLARRAGEDVLEVRGAVVLPGLHDHHIHLRALVAAGRSARVGPPEVTSVPELAAALQGAPVDAAGWRRAVGYDESVAGELDRSALDALAPEGPVRVQHRSGALWVVNSAGAAALGLEDATVPGVERDAAGRTTGRLWRADRWLADLLAGEDPATEIRTVSRRLAASGVTGVTDATPGASAEGVATLARAVEEGALVQRLHVMCPPGLSLSAHPLVSPGPHKVVLDDDRLPSLDELAAVVRATHGEQTPVAVHCVTAGQLALAVAAFESAGSVRGDRIEHGSVIHQGFVDVLTRLGLTVVTNPGFVHARGDAYLDDVDERDAPHLYRCASLLAAGVQVGAGTDAPFGPADPWVAVRAAVARRTSSGRALGATEAVTMRRAVALFSGKAAFPGRPRHVAVGEPGDLCVLAAGSVPGGDHDVVLATVVAGRVVHRSG